MYIKNIIILSLLFILSSCGNTKDTNVVLETKDIKWNLEENIDVNNNEDIKEDKQDFLWMKCKVDEEDITSFSKWIGWILIWKVLFNDDWSYTFNNKKDRYTTLKFETSFDVEKINDRTCDYRNCAVSGTWWQDSFYIWKNKKDNVIWIYKNKELLFSWFNSLYWVGIVNKELFFYWEDNNWKNFININWVKKNSINNYIVDKYKENNGDIFILYKSKSDKEYTWSTIPYNFYLYKNDEEIYSIENANKLDFWYLDNDDFYIIYNSNEIWYSISWGAALMINWEEELSRDDFNLVKIIHTNNWKYKIYSYQSSWAHYWIYINWEKYDYDNWDIIFELSPNQDWILFHDASKIYREEQWQKYSEDIKWLKVEAIKYNNSWKVYIWIQEGNIFKKYSCENE